MTNKDASVNRPPKLVMSQFEILWCRRFTCAVQPRRPHHKLTHYAPMSNDEFPNDERMTKQARMTNKDASVNRPPKLVMSQFEILWCRRFTCAVQPRRPHHKLTHYAPMSND